MGRRGPLEPHWDVGFVVVKQWDVGVTVVGATGEERQLNRRHIKKCQPDIDWAGVNYRQMRMQ